MRRLGILLALAAAFTLANCDDDVVRPDRAPVPVSRPASVTAGAGDGPRYSMQVLDVGAVLEAGVRVSAAGYLNDRGQVTALLFRDAGIGQPLAGVLIWDTETGEVQRVDLDRIIGPPFINDAGHLAGTTFDSSVPDGAWPYLWTPAGGFQRMAFKGTATGFNDRSQIVGGLILPNLVREAFLWDPAAGLRSLGTLPGHTESRAQGVNDASVVVGFSGTLNTADAVVWDPATGAMALADGGARAEAISINAQGQVVGGLSFVDEQGSITGRGSAVWASRDAQPILLPCEPPFEECVPGVINEQGVILGTYGEDEGANPMVWVDGQPYDLHQRVVTPNNGFFVLDINDRGQIGGTAFLEFVPGVGSTLAPMILTPISDTRTVRIDVKPGSDPNSFNLNGRGVLPVAVLGAADLDPDDVDPETLRLNGFVVGRRGNGSPQCGVEDVNDDGFDDLVCQFVDDLSRWTGPDDVAVLTGELRDGTAIEGTDTLRLVPPRR